MATTNDFLPFAVGASANVLSQSDYAALTALASGFQAGTAVSAQLNKVWRQSSIMSAVLAQFIVSNSGQSAVDDGTTPTLLANLTGAIQSLTRQQVVLADAGAANAYTAVNSPVLTALPSATGLVQRVSIANANTGASTYAPDGLVAKPILGMGLAALQGGELPAKGIATLLYVVASNVNSGNGAWVLIECTGGAQQIAPATQPQHAAQLAQLPAKSQSLSASVAANALTVNFTPLGVMQFPAASLTSGVPVPLSAAEIGNLSLVVPSGATLGATSGQSATLVFLLAYNGGIPVLCVTNLAGGLVLDETNLISPTTISAGATSAGVIYSASAVSANSPYLVVGMMQITEATAGVYATGHTLLRPTGGQVLAALSSFGYGAKWQSFLGSRGFGTTYYNISAKGRMVFVEVTNSVPVDVTINAYPPGGSAIPVGYGRDNTTTGGQQTGAAGFVPPGWSYTVNSSSSPTIAAWSELQ
ncbi:hypothetical protein OYT13_13775 [Pandoraea sp. XJJ-1]|uniref:hypothetical protein n=1 Tax=Pandoraea sp. XJJ-1 TaxID=3002643 RepID=UPI00227E16DC|nr:hypothetical protein [Pandoraea sp. XJJ-1]WAL80945.1 hypothetical protein OYT13_13775 [Pandoraea sp. XJJ-1]